MTITTTFNNFKVNCTTITGSSVVSKITIYSPNSNPINATYAGNGTWWTLHTFDGAGELMSMHHIFD